MKNIRFLQGFYIHSYDINFYRISFKLQVKKGISGESIDKMDW